MSNSPDRETFLEENAARVYNLALRLTGNPADAEDLAQDALLNALKALPSFRGEAAVFSWLYRITVNTWKNWIRAQKRRRFWKTLSLNFFKEEGEDQTRDLPSDDPPLDTRLETAETAAAVQDALLKLDEESRAVVVLREIEGLSYQQIAQSLQIPEGTVKSRLARARQTLKGLLNTMVRG